MPFYLRSGKALAARFSEVVIQFRCPPHLMFPLPAGQMLQCNRLTLRLQPNEGIHLNFQTKVPDAERVELRPADLAFDYRDAYGETALPEAYERLLLDAIAGRRVAVHADRRDRAGVGDHGPDHRGERAAGRPPQPESQYGPVRRREPAGPEACGGQNDG